jgi:hypothetical protein
MALQIQRRLLNCVKQRLTVARFQSRMLKSVRSLITFVERCVRSIFSHMNPVILVSWLAFVLSYIFLMTKLKRSLSSIPFCAIKLV